MPPKDLYVILGLSRGATADEIKRAYRRLAKQHHPDRNKGSADSEARFKEVQQAYAILSDPQRRKQYDATGHAGPLPEGGAWAERPGGARVYRWSGGGGQPVEFDLGDLADLFDFGGDEQGRSPIFEQFFSRRGGSSGARVEPQAPPPPADVEQAVDLSFEQAIHGATLELRIQGVRDETIQVKIPAGVRDGQRVRVRGKGGTGSGGRRGDIYILCRVGPHAYFRREEDDIYLDLPVTLAEAALGAKIEVPTLDGLTRVTVPPGTASGKKLRLAGCGVRNSQSEQRGDQYCVIRIVPPATLTDAQRKLLEELNESGLDNPRKELW